MALDAQTPRDFKLDVAINFYEIRFYAHDGGNDSPYSQQAD